MRRRELGKLSVTAAARAISELAKKGIIDSYFLRAGAEFPSGVDFLMMGTPVTIVRLTNICAESRAELHCQRRR